MNDWSLVASAENTTEKVIEKVNLFISDCNAIILDTPSGSGFLAHKLEEKYNQVFTLDIHKNNPFISDIKRFTKHDLNIGLPFKNEYFDCICSVEGIEHLENPSFFMREIYRSLKKGGIAIITTPNIDSFYSRLRVLLRAAPMWFAPTSSSTKDSGHLHTIDNTLMNGLAEKVGFELIDLDVNLIDKGKAGKNFFYEFIRLFFTKKYPEHLRKNIPFYGDVIIYTFKK